MSDVFKEDFLSRIVSVNWPPRGLITIETKMRLIVNTTPGDTSFATGWGPGLSSPLATGNLNTTIGPEFRPPAVSSKMRKLNTWGWKKYTKNNDVFGGASGATVIDRGLYNVQTDKGILTSYTDGLGRSLVPFIIDWNGENLGGGPPRVIDGKTLHTFPSGNGTGTVEITQVQALMLELYGLNAVHGASVYFPHLISATASHFAPGPSVYTYDRTYGTLNFLNLGKIRGGQSILSFTVTVPFVDGVNRADWQVRIATWKKEKKFPVDRFNALGDLSKAVTVLTKSDPGGAELDVPAKTFNYSVNLKTLNMTVTGP